MLDKLFGATHDRMAYAQRAERSAEAARENVAALKSRVVFLEHELERHALLLKTLVIVCEQSGAFSRKQFVDLRDLIDGQDGKVDGKLARKKGIRQCEKCRRANNMRARSCMWCGHAIKSNGVFE